MKYQFGITNKGTIWVRQFSDNNRLVSKRVLKGHTQYDTAFDKSGNALYALITNHITDKQYAKIHKIKRNAIEKFFDKILHRPQIDVKKLPMLDMNTLRNQGGFQNFVANMYEISSGYKNSITDTIVQDIKNEYLKQTFR